MPCRVYALLFLALPLFAQQNTVVQRTVLPEITSLSGRIIIPDTRPIQSVQNFLLKDYNTDV